MGLRFRCPEWFAVVVVWCLIALPTYAAPITIDWVTVGDPGNAADTAVAPNVGVVAYSYQIMKYEFTNTDYAAFLNAVAATDSYSLYNAAMGSDARGGITRNGTSGNYTYTVKANMGDKPVNMVSWFDAARVANWLHNGQGSGGTETGAYTLVGGQTSGTAPGRNPGAKFYIPTDNEWYKAAYYKGGGTNAGYWGFATQSNTAPTAVTAGSTGNGSAGSTGNFANWNNAADWNSQNGNVTTVGTNGGASGYGTFDQTGNVMEWNDSLGVAETTKGIRGGRWEDIFANNLSSSSSFTDAPSFEGWNTGIIGFRLASPVPVPEPSTYAMALAGIACGGFSMWRRRKQA